LGPSIIEVQILSMSQINQNKELVNLCKEGFL